MNVVRLGVAELREHGRLEVPGRLGVREPLALPGQGDVEVRGRAGASCARRACRGSGRFAGRPG